MGVKHFVVFKKNSWEKKNAYSLVDDKTLATISTELIHDKMKVEDRLYTKEEFELMRDSLVL